MDRVDFHRAFWFPVTPDQLWVTVERFDQFPSWWSWLGEFRADSAGLVAGNVLRGLVVPPLPARLRLEVRLQRCERPRLIEAVVGGDLRGHAALRLAAAGAGTRVWAAWSLQLDSAALRAAARVAYPLLRRGHDCVVDMAVTGFRQRALPGPGTHAGVAPDAA